ncbi:hypothetical protein ACVWY3_006710 [Bradyrhizobium sp. USDA 4486]
MTLRLAERAGVAIRRGYRSAEMLAAMAVAWLPHNVLNLKSFCAPALEQFHCYAENMGLLWKDFLYIREIRP